MLCLLLRQSRNSYQLIAKQVLKLPVYTVSKGLHTTNCKFPPFGTDYSCHLEMIESHYEIICWLCVAFSSAAWRVRMARSQISRWNV